MTMTSESCNIVRWARGVRHLQESSRLIRVRAQTLCSIQQWLDNVHIPSMPWNGHMAVVNVTQACNELPDMVDRVQDEERITITSKNRNAILMSEGDTTASWRRSTSSRIRTWRPTSTGPAGHRCRRWRSGIARIHRDPGSIGKQGLRGYGTGLRPEGGCGARTAPLGIGSAGG